MKWWGQIKYITQVYNMPQNKTVFLSLEWTAMVEAGLCHPLVSTMGYWSLALCEENGI